MAQYTRTTTVDSSETGDSVKQAVLDVDADLTGIIAAYNTHDTATTDVHGCTGAATGTGALVRATSPTLVTPALGTPSAIILTNASGSCTLTTVTATSFVGALTGNVTGNVTGDVTGGGTLTSATFVTCALGTPSSGTLTNCTGLPIATGVSGLGTGVAAFLATPSSANLASAVTDETGSGKLVFDTSPTITTPTISGHPVIEGVTPTGATGTGKLVFDTSPTLVTPNIGAASGTSLTLSGLTASLPVFTDANSKLITKSLLAAVQTLRAQPAGALSLADSATIAIDWNSGATYYILLKGTGRTVTFANPVNGSVYRIIIQQDANGSRTITTWPTIYWSGGLAPTLSTAGNSIDIVTLLYIGTTYYGDFSKNFAVPA